MNNRHPKEIRLLFAGGGTGGHLFPAIAVADRLRQLLGDNHRVDIHFVGTRRGLEYRLRDRLGYPLHLINVRGWIRSFTWKNLLVPFLLIGSIIKVNALLKEYKPNLVIGTGGYVSLPVLQAAAARGISTVIQEQNSFPGIATRKAARHATCIYLGFKQAQTFLHTNSRIMVTGNPVRSGLKSADRSDACRAFSLDPGKKTILILGGSQGARSINHAVLASLSKRKLPDDYQLLWQTGKRDYEEVIAKAGDLAKTDSLFPFDERMALVYGAADIAITRAGALTLAELLECRIPAVVIPYPFAAGDHQRKNARASASAGFVKLLEPDRIHDTDLMDLVVTLTESGQAAHMRAAMEQHLAGRQPAVDQIATDIVRLLTEKQNAEAGIDT